MNARIFSVVMAVTLVSLSSGCSGMRNFLFGRGARCGLCQRLSDAGNALNPLAPAPYTPSAGPGWRGEPVCGYEGPTCGYEGPVCGYEAPRCGSCVGSGYLGRRYSWGDQVDSGYGSVRDPYLNGQYLPGPVLPYDGQIIQGPVVSDEWNPRDGEVVQPPSAAPSDQ